MTSSITLKHQVLHDTMPVISELDKKTNWDQRQGKLYLNYLDVGKCCVGTHIAKYFELPFRKCLESKELYYDFSDGVRHLEDSIGVKLDVLEDLFSVCGAPWYPFSAKEWLIEPSLVWKRMLMVEKIINSYKLRLIQRTYNRYNHRVNIVDHHILFDGVLEFNYNHPKAIDKIQSYNKLTPQSDSNIVPSKSSKPFPKPILKPPIKPITQSPSYSQLTPQDVREIKVLLKRGEETQKAIADMYNVSQSTISDIHTGKTWAHIK